MSVYISVFKVNQAGDALDVIITTDVGETIESVNLWNQDSYKDFSQAKNFDSKLTKVTNSESFTINASEIGENRLTGIYFIEVTDSSTPETGCTNCSNKALGVATDFSRFSFCLTELLCNIKDCYGFFNQELNKALTLKLYIDSLRDSLQLGNFTTAIAFWKNLNRACKSECTECSNLDQIAKKGLGFQTLGNQIILY